MPPVAYIVQVQAKIQWEFYQDPVSHRWIALCKPLKLVLEAATHTELRENIEDSLRLFMRSIFEDGQFERFMRDHGWVAHNVPQNVSANDIRFDVPIELIARKTTHGSTKEFH